MALAHDVSLRSLRGTPTLELGCGLGLPSIAAALAGGRVLATDWSPDAVRATAANAERNGVELETLQCSWAEPDALWSAPRGRSCSPATCSTRRRNVEQLLDLLPRLVDETGLVLLADPGRVPAERFLAAAPERGWTVKSIASPRAPSVLIHRLRRTPAG